MCDTLIRELRISNLESLCVLLIEPPESMNQDSGLVKTNLVLRTQIR